MVTCQIKVSNYFMHFLELVSWNLELPRKGSYACSSVYFDLLNTGDRATDF